MVEVVAFTGPLADAGEHGVTAVLFAMLLISSMMSTVLPTPAPPNRPILPPLVYGASRSTTLMPVTRSRCSVDWSTNSGAAVDRPFLASRTSIGPLSSIGLADDVHDAAQRVSGPTGHFDRRAGVGHFLPRVRPSVVSMAMVRTVFSPRCCATSQIRLTGCLRCCPPMQRVQDFGRSPSNSTSTTAPIT